MTSRDRLTAAMLALGVLAPVEAFASTSHYIELQFDTASVAAIIQKRLQTDQQNCPTAVPCPSNPSATCYLDHVEVQSPGVFSRGTTALPQQINSYLTRSSSRIEFTQAVRLHTKTETCVNTPGCSTTTPNVSLLKGHLVLTGDDLCVEVDEFVTPLSSIPTPQVHACVGLSGAKLLDALDLSGATVSGKAFSMSTSGDRLALRTEVSIPPYKYIQGGFQYDANRVAAWQSFINGTLAPAVGAGQWRTFMHRTLLQEKLDDLIDQFVASDSSMLSSTPLQLAWMPLGSAGASAVMSTSLLTQQGSCQIDVDVGAPFLVTKNADGDGLHLSGQMTYNASDWDIFKCGLQTGDLLFAFGTLIAGQLIDIDLTANTDFCSVSSKGDFDCNLKTHPQTMNFGYGHMAIATLDEVYGTFDGLFMSGPLMSTGPAVPVAFVQVQPPSLGLRGNCSQASCAIEGGVYVTGNAKVCQLSVSNDLMNLFDVEVSGFALPANVSIKLKPTVTDAQIAAFNAAPYDLHVTIGTNAGLNTYAVTPSLITFAQQELWCGVFEVERFVQCLETEPPPWENPYDRWANDWALDPHVEIPAQIHEYGTGLFDEAVISQIDIAVTFRRGLVDTVTITGVLSSMFKGSSVKQQELVINVPGLRGMRASSAAEVVDGALLGGYAATVEIDSRLLPVGVRAYTEFVIPGEMLLEAASH